MKKRLERLPAAAALGLAVLVVGVCAIRLPEDRSATQSSVYLASKSDATAAKLEQCRTVTYEQKEALLECQKIWAEQRRQFLAGSRSTGDPDSRTGAALFLSPVPRKDESRLPSGFPSIPSQSE
ncbi:putative entry exclusion protein TrbK-alt [Bradyrhizobium sp. 168]|uniref:putative entry exclusion protein TrbK-alt n=1 Tax=Bradyrhizobium sp. 168 TaxID=2782639 RepID=UPI001FFB6418|nr:putative entry exclusion protein TrbK-alt [Bradyrhizobium sp. 168]MCK1581871.1 putative entry exclusion protein TrbK-alt [Bradyrhizobium sp. 168]